MSNEEQSVTENSDFTTSEFSELFIGYVDLIQHDLISGWVAYKKDRSKAVKVELWIGSRCFITQSADAYRSDLVSIRSDGRCAFELKLPPILESVASKSQKPACIIVTVDNAQSVLLEDVFKESTEKASENARTRTREAFFLAQVLHSVDDEKEQSNTTACVQAAQNETFLSQIHALTPDTLPAAQQKLTTNAEIPELSRYVRYTLERLKRDSQFKVDDNPWEASDALMWFIEGYGSARKPLRIPLSKKEIDFCNTMLNFPGCRFLLSRAHYFYLLKNCPEFAPATVLNDESKYRDEVYNWVNEIAIELNISDVLVPVDYIESLKQLRPHWKDRRFPLNDYFEIRRHKESSWHVFSSDSALERGLMYLVAWLESGGKPECAQFMPVKVWKELFEITNQDGQTFFEEIAMEFLENVSVKEIHELSRLITKSQHKLLRDTGFDLNKLAYITCDAQGNRRHLPNKVSVQNNEGPCNLQVIGPFGSASGLGQATRLSVLAMREAGLNPHLVNFDLDNPAPTGFSTAMDCGSPRQSKVNLVHLNAEAAPIAAAYLPDIFSDSYNIGFFFWELDSPAKCHSLALDMFDEIWVSTEYGVQQYSPYFDNQVTNVGMTYEDLETPSKIDCRARLNDSFGIEPDETVYLTTFDSYSFVQRKNPMAVIRSFLEAFPKGDERVRLIIKTQNRNSVLDPVQQKIWKSIDRLIAMDSRILLINRTMKYTDLLWFKKAADCYVSLHRSEGWGFGMIESMMLEVPVIATGYSGNLEFCKEEHCWLVETDEVYLDHNDYIFVAPGQKWGEPRINDAAKCMRNAYEDEHARISKAKLASDFVRQNFCPSAIGQRYAERLKIIEENIQSKESIDIAA